MKEFIITDPETGREFVFYGKKPPTEKEIMETISEAPDEYTPPVDLPPETTPKRPLGEQIKRLPQMAVRGANPVLAGMTIGGIVGAPAGPPGIAAGALVGGAAVPLADTSFRG